METKRSTYPLYDLAEWKNGLAFRNVQFSDSGRPVIKIAELKDGVTGQTKFTQQTFGQEFAVESDDMLFSWSGNPDTSIDVFRWRGPSGWLNQHIFKVRPKEQVDQSYFYYVLKYLKPVFAEIARNKQTTGLGHVTIKDLKAIEVDLPSRAEQRAVAYMIGALDEKIELNHRMNETLEQIAQTLFRSWFMDFDPVNAKAEGRKPEGMDAVTASLFPKAFDDSVAGRIPTGWRVAPIGECVQAVGGGTPKTGEFAFWEGGSIHWATPKDLAGLTSPVLLDTERKITEEGLRQVSSGLLPAGTVLLSSRAPIGYLAISEVPVAINQGFVGMVCDGPLSNHFVLHWTRSKMDVIESRANGSTFMEISKAAFRPIPVVVPPKAIVDAFSEIAGSLHRKMVGNLRESALLAEMRNQLLPRLISGEVRLPDNMVNEFAG